MPRTKEPQIFTPLSNTKQPQGNGVYIQCLNGHNSHSTKIISIDMDGEYHGIKDVPWVPAHLAKHFKLEVYDWIQYFNVDAKNNPTNKYDIYCPAQCIISFSLDVQGIFEGYESLLALDILSQPPRSDEVCLDYGSHVGLYTIMCALSGRKVAAVDSLQENIDIVIRNAKLNGVAYRVFPYCGWLDEDVPMLSPYQETVHFLKADVEGAEQYVLAQTRDLLMENRVNYALMEISPCFDDYYPALCKEIVGYGYDMYKVPGKTWAMTNEYAEQPLATLKKYCKVPEAGIEQVVNTWSQENVLFCKANI